MSIPESKNDNSLAGPTIFEQPNSPCSRAPANHSNQRSQEQAEDGGEPLIHLNTLSILCQYSVTSATCDRLIRSLAGDVQQAVEHVVCHDQSDYHL